MKKKTNHILCKHGGADQRNEIWPFGSPRSIRRIKSRMYADGLLPEATTTTTPIAT